ncbi:MAG: NUDIX domain-containing protein [Bacillota bacterium]
MDFRVRVTGVLVEDGSILLVRQRVNGNRDWVAWNLESRWSSASREIREETGLEVELRRLLYICDLMEPDRQALHITVEIRRTGGHLVLGTEPELDANPISDVRFVPIQHLTQHHFSETFMHLAVKEFPDAGRYAGDIQNIGL